MPKRTHREYIKLAIQQNGEYSHNIISMSLAAIDRTEGKAAAMAVIKKYKLDEKFGITGP